MLLNHVRLSALVAAAALREDVVAAADKACDLGASPRAQIDAARKIDGRRLGYLPHQGAKERAKRLQRMARAEDNG